MSDRSDRFVTLVEVKTFDSAWDIRAMLLLSGMHDANVWPEGHPNPLMHDSLLVDVGPYAVMVPEGSLGEAQRLLRESGLEPPGQGS
ncbi:MAG: hypothetical protein ABR941_07250 [Thermoleophilia bacterium]